MATAPLFDLTTIDLDHIAISAEEVGKINPHAGHMRHLDHVIHVSDDLTLIIGVKHVRHDEFWVAGHIPGRPLLPGVLMIEAAAQLSSLLYSLKVPQTQFMGFTRCDNAAFRSQVLPGDTLHLVTREHQFSHRRFITDNQGFVGDNMVFEVRVTGMRL